MKPTSDELKQWREACERDPLSFYGYVSAIEVLRLIDCVEGPGTGDEMSNENRYGAGSCLFSECRDDFEALSAEVQRQRERIERLESALNASRLEHRCAYDRRSKLEHLCYCDAKDHNRRIDAALKHP